MIIIRATDFFQEDAIDFFVEMTPCLHNYVVVDTPALLQQEKNLEIIFLMCKKVCYLLLQFTKIQIWFSRERAFQYCHYKQLYIKL